MVSGGHYLHAVFSAKCTVKIRAVLHRPSLDFPIEFWVNSRELLCLALGREVQEKSFIRIKINGSRKHG